MNELGAKFELHFTTRCETPNPGVNIMSIIPLMDYIRYIGSKLSINIKGISLLVGYIRYIGLNPGVSTLGISPLMDCIRYIGRNLVSI